MTLFPLLNVSPIASTRLFAIGRRRNFLSLSLSLSLCPSFVPRIFFPRTFPRPILNINEQGRKFLPLARDHTRGTRSVYLAVCPSLFPSIHPQWLSISPYLSSFSFYFSFSGSRRSGVPAIGQDIFRLSRVSVATALDERAPRRCLLGSFN